MKTLEQEVNRIKNEIADIGCKAMFGKTCEELVQEIIKKQTRGCGEIGRRNGLKIRR